MNTNSWRTVDIVVTAAIAVAFGVVYWAWIQVYNAVGVATAGFPPAQNIVAVYPIGVLKSSPNQAVAQAFVAYVKSPAGQATLASFGFLPPS